MLKTSQQVKDHEYLNKAIVSHKITGSASGQISLLCLQTISWLLIINGLYTLQTLLLHYGAMDSQLLLASLTRTLLNLPSVAFRGDLNLIQSPSILNSKFLQFLFFAFLMTLTQVTRPFLMALAQPFLTQSVAQPFLMALTQSVSQLILRDFLRYSSPATLTV